MADPSLKGPEAVAHNGSALRIGIVHARWNKLIIDALLAGVRTALSKCNVPDANIVVQSVPGSWELPSACSSILTGTLYQYDALIAIGVLIKGETMHFEYISSSVTTGLMTVQLERNIPITLGVLTVLTEDQARARSGLVVAGGAKPSHNHGEDWGYAAVEMGLKRKSWKTGSLAVEK